MVSRISDRVGTVLGGRYRLLREVGAGGHGQVFEAEQVGLGRRVAVKILHEADPTALARLRQEAATAGALRHPHVVAVLDFVAEPGAPPFLVMELLEGESLAALGRREAPLAPPRAVKIALQMLSGLAAAHAAGLVHRDVKPANVWITPTLGGEAVKLLDFGLVRAGDVRMTETGYVVGTPQFLAPEQLRGEPIDGRVDLHAVGLVLWMLVTGHLPWRKDLPMTPQTLDSVPPSLDTMVPGLPVGLSDVVARALAKRQDARWPSAEEMYGALAPFAEAVAAPPTIAMPPPRPETPRRARPRVGVFVAGLLVPLIAAAAALPWLVRSGASVNAKTSATASASASATASTSASVVAVANAVADADVPAPRVPTPIRPTLRLAGADDRQVCACVADISPQRNGRSRGRVCPIPHAPRCTCDSSFAMALCPEPQRGGACAVRTDARPVGEPGSACEGYQLDADQNAEKATGKLRCDRCIGNQLYVGAVTGQPCRGLHDGAGKWLEGTWDCFAR